MVALRASRRKAILISSDDDGVGGELQPGHRSSIVSDDDNDEPIKPQKRSTKGKLRPVKKEATKHPPTPSSMQHGSSQKSPVKAKVSKGKAKAEPKQEQAKANVKPIYSFFNAATQRQRSTPLPSASPEKASEVASEADAIHDDSDGAQGQDVQFTKGSQTALALRKRKVQHGESFESEFGVPQSGSQKFRKASNGDRVPSLAIVNEDKRPWTEQFAPKDLSELAVHKKKVTDVRQWFEMALKGRKQRVLVLKGAAGTGKTTTVRLLAQDMGIRVMEWANPAAVESGLDSTTGGQFAEFLGRAGSSYGLQMSYDGDASSSKGHDNLKDPSATENNMSLLLVEEFPNTFSRTSSTLQAFRSTIMQYLSAPTLPQDTTPTPLVLVISETLLSTNTALADSFTAHRLLGPELVHHPFLDMIDFNAVAQTFLIKALETIVVKEARKSGRRRTPGPQVLKHLAESGDIRSAISSLEFLCLRGDEGDSWSSKITFGKQKKSKVETPLTQSEVDALKLVSNRESILGIFHAVGKVVYNKRKDAPAVVQPPSWLPQHRRNKAPEVEVDSMIDELGTDVLTFVAALHENYALSCGSNTSEESLDSLVGCIDTVSDADLLSVDRFSFGTRAFSGSATDSLRQDEMAFQCAVRGLLFHLPHPVHRSVATNGRRADAHKMYYPASLKMWKQREEVEGVLDLLTAKAQAGGLMAAYHVVTMKSAQGVDGWKRNTSAPDHDQLESSDTSSAVTNSMKTEMLIERLPYLARIMSTKPNSSALAEQIAVITRLGRTVLEGEDDDDGDCEDASAEQWSTDRPDAEFNPAKSSKSKSGRSLMNIERQTLPVDRLG